MLRRTLLLACLGLLTVGAPALAQEVRNQRVQFARGATSATLQGTIAGWQSINYRLGAAAGQTLRVSIRTSNTSAYFNVYAPGQEPGRGEAMFIGSSAGDSMTAPLTASGEHTIQVYLMRNAARRGERARFTLEVSVTGGPAASAPHPSMDALVPGTNFHATGNLACARATGQPLAQCHFGVVRGSGGAGAVTVFLPDGGSRVIHFERGVPVRYDSAPVDHGARMVVSRNADLFVIGIGPQRFEIPEAVITGG